MKDEIKFFDSNGKLIYASALIYIIDFKYSIDLRNRNDIRAVDIEDFNGECQIECGNLDEPIVLKCSRPVRFNGTRINKINDRIITYERFNGYTMSNEEGIFQSKYPIESVIVLKRSTIQDNYNVYFPNN